MSLTKMKKEVMEEAKETAEAKKKTIFGKSKMSLILPLQII